MSADWESWEAAEDAGAFDNVKLKTKDTTNLRQEIDQKQFKRNDDDADIRGCKVTSEYETQQTAAFQVRLLKRSQQPEQKPGASTQQADGFGPGSFRSFREREADYAKARERIFGSDSSREATPSPAVTPRIASPVNKAAREPNGPDGTSGFGPRRN